MADFFKSIFKKITNSADVDWDELEANLIRADLGFQMTQRILTQLKSLGRKISEEDVEEAARKEMSLLLPDLGGSLSIEKTEKPKVILVIGVNGTGKTTSTAKLGAWLKKQHQNVVFAAVDTFRAAAVEQLEHWGKVLNLPVVKGNPNADPSSVCYQAHQKAISTHADFLICDTAGRLHTRHNLMEELGKIRRTIAKQDPEAPHYTLLVCDATTGNNALQQAKEFHKACPIDGIILTKLDGSGKGGVAFSIYEQLGILPYFIGTGEAADAFEPFDKASFLAKVL